MTALLSLSNAVSSTVYVPAGKSNYSQLPVHWTKPPSSVFLAPPVVFRTLPSASRTAFSRTATRNWLISSGPWVAVPAPTTSGFPAQTSPQAALGRRRKENRRQLARVDERTIHARPTVAAAQFDNLNSTVHPQAVFSAATSAPWSLKSLRARKSRTARRGLISVFVNGVQNMCRLPGPNWAAPSFSPRRVSR
jgi:hypothetical protein